MTVVLAPIAFGLAAALAPAATVHPGDVEARLSTLIGDWTEAGKETSYRDRCIWYDGRAFVVCSLTESVTGLRVEAIVGYSSEDRRFTYQSYDNKGGSHVQYGYPLGERGLVCTDERKINGQDVRLTTSMIPQSDGRLRMFQERSVMGGRWESVGEVYYVPRR